MLTLFTTAKPFTGHAGIIQRNALRSWKLLHPQAEVILFGDEEGAAEVCEELDLRHEPHVERHESGMKYLNYLLDRAQGIARHKYLCYLNCDIILLEDFRAAFEIACRWRAQFLLVSRRWDTDVAKPINFNNPTWAADLRRKALSEGLKQRETYVDFFVFQRGVYTDVPSLVVGRSYWDWWFVGRALEIGIPVVDCSDFVVPVHQNHDYGYHPAGKMGTHEDGLAMRNYELAGGEARLRWIDDATHRLRCSGHISFNPRRYKRTFREMRRFLTYRVWLPLWHLVLDVTRPVRSVLGLRSKDVRS